MKRLVTALSLLAALAMASAATAQESSRYTQSLLNQYSFRNSAAAYSTDRIRNSVYNSVIPQFRYSNVNRGLFSGQMTKSSSPKPFSSHQQGSSVSPYLALSSPFTSTATSYYTQVRPALEQQRTNDQLQRQSMAMQRQLNRMAVQPPYDPTGAQGRAPTGHGSVFMNYGGYYPQSR